ncbi:hypothetical protein tinsulaeT_18120 [Thalassotalea insulae]|uniref:Uncharacterized protein n=1 Tax=Thalassotalea insulae TaxID=2056778 RepID=A0ABQ6GSY3_9GAMM|nr:hypothetical protein [Thalassotalea insulae]GLX78472.1 hypothetical protein tinsulaeT_18120 [Thalassotalea insulae]
MKNIDMPIGLYEVFGEQQSIAEIIITIVFALIGSALIYFCFYRPSHQEVTWMTILGLILVVDVLAGCIANFTRGTNQFYSERAKNRIIFISIHIHILVIAWLLAAPMEYAVLVWAYTIGSAFLINYLKGHPLQMFFGAFFMCCGLLGLMLMPIEQWFLITSMFFMIKVVFSFAVDHYKKE